MDLYVVSGVAEEHISKCAWLYTCTEINRANCQVSGERLASEQRFIYAHLDGIVAAGLHGLRMAKRNFAKWQSGGELFCYLHAAISANSKKDIALCSKAIEAGSADFHDSCAAVTMGGHSVELLIELLRAVDFQPLALMRLTALGLRREAYPPERASTQLAQPAQSAQGQPMQAVLPCAPLATFFTHDDPALRAEACRYAGRLRRFDCLPHVHLALTDADADVREQAAIALLVCNEPAAALPELFAAIMRHAALVDQGGIASIRAERRAQHLARLLGHAIPFPCAVSAAEALLTQLPPYLAILTLAYHGNPALIPLLLPFLRAGENPTAQPPDQQYAVQPLGKAPTVSAPKDAATQDPVAASHGGLYKRRALWALGFILGINPEHEGLLADDPTLSADWPIAPGLDQDTGLPEGDADKVERWWQAHYNQYIQMSTSQQPAPQWPASTPQSPAPLLSGKRMDAPAAAKELLASGMQAQRFAAALHACRLSPAAPWVDTRAPWALQKRWMEQIPV